MGTRGPAALGDGGCGRRACLPQNTRRNDTRRLSEIPLCQILLMIVLPLAGSLPPQNGMQQNNQYVCELREG